jgi:hypothetical protein
VSPYVYNHCGPRCVARCIPKLVTFKRAFRERSFCSIHSLYDSYLSYVEVMLGRINCENRNGEWEFSRTDWRDTRNVSRGSSLNLNHLPSESKKDALLLTLIYFCYHIVLLLALTCFSIPRNTNSVTYFLIATALRKRWALAVTFVSVSRRAPRTGFGQIP